MKSLALASAFCLAAGAAAQAQPAGSVEAFLDGLHGQVDSRLTEAGVNIGGAPARLHFNLDRGGRVYGLRVIRSTGSPSTDALIEQTLGRMQMDQVPRDLVGADITLVVAPADDLGR